MPISDDDFDKMLDEEQGKLDSQFDSRIKLSREVLAEICPMPIDKDRLNSLIAAVGSGTTENEAKIQLAKNMETYGVVVVRLLRKFVLG